MESWIHAYSNDMPVKLITGKKFMSTNLTFELELIKKWTFNFLDKIYFMHHFHHFIGMLQISVWDCTVI
jgi:hypothetical protein